MRLSKSAPIAGNASVLTGPPDGQAKAVTGLQTNVNGIREPPQGGNTKASGTVQMVTDDTKHRSQTDDRQGQQRPPEVLIVQDSVVACDAEGST